MDLSAICAVSCQENPVEALEQSITVIVPLAAISSLGLMTPPVGLLEKSS
jgi:hypothetical protein